MCYAINTLPNQERRHFMEMVKKKAFDPSMGEVYEVEMPAPKEVRKGILELEFPPEGIQVKEAVAQLADKFQLSDEQRNAKYKSGSNIFYINVVRREFRRLLDDGTLVQPNGKGTPYCLSQTPPRPPSHDPAPTPEPSVSVAETYRGIRKKLEETLLEELRDINPTLFEQLVVDLISKMGYGTGEHVGRVGDGGIDGIVKDHRLGLYEVYIQTKRQKSNVSNTAINKFKNALKLQDARMGIFVATSGFSKRAKDAAVSSAANPEEGFRIVGLIDGKQLARLLLEYNVFHG